MSLESDRGAYRLLEAVDRSPRYLAQQYAAGEGDFAMAELVRCCMDLHNRRRPEESIAFALEFRNALVHSSAPTLVKTHDVILDLFVVGLPINPVHVASPDLSTLDYESLKANPAYARLLAGIRLMELDYRKAYEWFGKARDEFTVWFGECALIQYAAGQSARKMGYYADALGKYNDALLRVACWQDCGQCSCGASCSAPTLMAEIHRGIATVLRRQQQWENSEEEFDKGSRYLPTKGHEVVRSDFLFSRGYFYFEWAAKDSPASAKIRNNRHRLTERIEAKISSKLSRALELFEESTDLRKQWCAPLGRAAIVRLLLGKGKKEDFIYAREVARGESGIEPALSAINSGFAVLLHWPTDPSYGLTPSSLFNEVLRVYRNKIIARGPRECHAFDNAVIFNAYRGITFGCASCCDT